MNLLSRTEFLALATAAGFGALELAATAQTALASEPTVTEDEFFQYAIEMHGGDYTLHSNANKVDQLLDRFRSAWALSPPNDRLTLVLHFHGGLVTGDVAKLIGRQVFPVYHTPRTFPIFFLWHSGPFEVNLGRSIFTQAGAISTPHGMLNRGSVLGARTLGRVGSGTSHDDGDKYDVTRVEEAARLFNVVDARNGYDYMKYEIDCSFCAEPPETKGAAKVVQQLIDMVAEYGEMPRVVLVGHSMGGIYACRFIQEFDSALRRDSRPHVSSSKAKFDVITMAPAATFALFNDTLQLNRISNIRIFTMSDSYERNDHVFRGALFGIFGSRSPFASQLVSTYPHSLLYLISGILEAQPDTPLIGMDRFWRGAQFWDNPLVGAIKAQLAAINQKPENYLVLSPTDVAGRRGFRTRVITHGGFDCERYTLDSIDYILQSRFTAGKDVSDIPRDPCDP